ncbi:MAG: hypothetical protein ACM3WR_00685 [Solirubrobacterales bacterium]
MSEEIVVGQEHEEQGAEIVHEDIMQRLLNYQRHLREGDSPSEAAGAVTATMTETDMVVDLTHAEAELEAVDLVVIEEAAEPTSPAENAPAVPTAADLAARVAELEHAVARVSAMITDLRNRFQDMAVDSDERLAAVSEALSEAGGSGSA